MSKSKLLSLLGLPWWRRMIGTNGKVVTSDIVPEKIIKENLGKKFYVGNSFFSGFFFFCTGI